MPSTPGIECLYNKSNWLWFLNVLQESFSIRCRYQVKRHSYSAIQQRCMALQMESSTPSRTNGFTHSAPLSYFDHNKRDTAIGFHPVQHAVSKQLSEAVKYLLVLKDFIFTGITSSHTHGYIGLHLCIKQQWFIWENDCKLINTDMEMGCELPSNQSLYGMVLQVEYWMAGRTSAWCHIQIGNFTCS